MEWPVSGCAKASKAYDSTIPNYVPSGILNKVRRKEKKYVIINWTSESEKKGFQYLLKSTFNSF